MGFLGGPIDPDPVPHALPLSEQLYYQLDLAGTRVHGIAEVVTPVKIVRLLRTLLAVSSITAQLALPRASCSAGTFAAPHIRVGIRGDTSDAGLIFQPRGPRCRLG